jgi:PAH dioxygenase large subunit
MLSNAQEILDKASTGIVKGQLPLRIFKDPDIYQIELSRIYARCWIYVGHESEIPSPGDYCLRYIGEDPFVLVRDEHGDVRVLFNSCRHRGTAICRAENGNTSHFRCPYHGWTYSNDGRLVGVPQKEMVFRALDLENLSLHEARSDTYNGLVFACIDPATPPLPEYLGDMKWYLDVHFKATGGMEVLGPPHRWTVDVDWKTIMDNFAGDSYHTAVVHKSVIDLGLMHSSALVSQQNPNDARVVNISNVGTANITEVSPDQSFFWGYPKEVVATFTKDAVTPAQWERARRAVVHTSSVFPNLGLFHAGGTDNVKKPFSGYLFIRTPQPKGPGKTELWTWVLAPKNAPKHYKDRAYECAIMNNSPAAHVMMDDIAVWNGISKSAGTVYASKTLCNVNYLSGMESMSGPLQIKKDWPGPGLCVMQRHEEGTMRTFYNRWVREMTHGN